MGLLGDEEHPDPSATALHKILDFFVLLIGIACIIFSAYYMNALKASSFFALIILFIGIGAIIVSIIGFFGSGYYKGGEKEGRLICLRVFWLASLLFAAVLFMFGGICLASPETLQSYILVYYSQFTDMTNQFGGQAGAVIQQLTALLNNFGALGGAAVGIGVYMLLCFGCSSYIMGMRIFLLTCAMFGSIGILIIGVIIIILSTYFQTYVEIMASISKILIGGIVLGSISIICGALGLVAYWLHKKLPLVLKGFTLVVIALGLAYLIVGILSFSLISSLDSTLRDKSDEICSSNVALVDNDLIANDTPCYKLVENSITYECSRVRNGEMSPEICPFKQKGDSENVPNPPNCFCAGSTEDYIKSLPDVSSYVAFAYLSNKQSVISNYKILGMICIVTAVLLGFITVTLLMSCLCYTPEKLAAMDDDDKYEWVYEDEVDDSSDDEKK